MNLFNNINLSTPSKLGLIYQGSKTKINFDLFQVIHQHSPYANYFYDLFGGGGGMSFNAVQYGYITHYNELSIRAYSIIEYLVSKVGSKNKYGMLDDECYRFIGSKEFKEIFTKENKSAVDYLLLNIYSFGNNSKGYFCSKEKEINKINGHYFILDNSKIHSEYYCDIFSDFTHIIRELNQEVFKNIDWTNRRKIWVNVCLKMEVLTLSNTSREFPKWDFKTLYNLKEIDIINHINRYAKDLQIKEYKGGKGWKKLKQLQQLQRLQRLGQLEQLQRLEQLQQLEQLEQLTLSNTSYDNVNINTNPEQTIIYCDPPYKDTDISGYDKTSNTFDYDRFYDYCINKAKQGYNIFISEYNMPEDRFECIYMREVLNNKNNKAKNRIEKLFKVRL